MRKLFSVAALAVVSTVLASCGGGAFQSSSTGTGTTTTPTVASLSVTSDVKSIPSDGSSSANITVIAKDASNAVVNGATISFTASGGASVTATQGTTDTTGTAKATLTVGTAAAGASITVTAANGTVTGTTTLTVSNAKKTMTLLTSSATIPSDNSTGATISALVKDANNNLLAGVPVSFMVSSGAISPVQTKAGAAASPAVVAGTTDANGLAQALVTTPGDPSNRAITVNATAGTATGQLIVNVTGTQLTLSGPGNVVINNTAPFTAVLSNAAGQGIPNIAMTVTSALNNTVTATPSLTTDSNGKVTFSVTGVTGGNDTITASAAGLTKTAALSVSPESFNITAPADQTNVIIGTQQTVTVKWTNNGAPVVNKPVTVVTNRGTVTPITAACVAPLPTTSLCTDANGQVQVSVGSTSGGTSIVEASGTDSSTTPVTNVSATVNLQFVANNPAEIAVQAGPNAVSIQGQSTITAIVRDAAQNLVQGAKVDFALVTDPTSGSLSTAQATTDVLGQAKAVYTGGSVQSPSNGVTISAKVDATSISASTTLTVGGQAVGLSFGTGQTIDVSQGPAIYQVTYTVLAVDSHGANLPNQPITFSVLPVAYGKGIMVGCPGGQNWGPQYNTAANDTHAYTGPGLLRGAGNVTATMCMNEDTDYTGNIASLDPPTPSTCTNKVNGMVIPSHVKDYNCNGALDPGSVASVSPSSGVTDANGRLDVKVTYNRDHAYWTLVTLVASTTVSGTESSTSATFTLQGALPDYACSAGPPGPISPYGQAATCADPR